MNTQLMQLHNEHMEETVFTRMRKRSSLDPERPSWILIASVWIGVEFKWSGAGCPHRQ
jgi:hypothetical protein